MAVASREAGRTEVRHVGDAGAGQEAAGGENGETVRHIVFFDVETNVRGRMCRTYELLEFGAVVLDVRGLGELGSFHTLIRPTDLSCIDRRTSECNIITSAPTFADVADAIYRLLHGHIWAGHNILNFDIRRVNEAFLRIGQQAPQPFGVIDTYPLLGKTFGRRAGDLKLATLAGYCGYGKQEHRSIADVRMNIDVLRSCATVLFLEANYPDILRTQMEVTACASVSEQLEDDIREREAFGHNISRGLEAMPSNQDPRTEFEGIPFLLASCVSLPSIEVQEKTSVFGHSRMLYYEGFPLHLLEFKV